MICLLESEWALGLWFLVTFPLMFLEVISFLEDPAIAKPLANGESTDAPDLWPLWSALDGLPILTVRGSSSDILSAETARRMGAEHSGPFELAEIAGRGHAPMLDEPAATWAITGFLKKYAQSAHPVHA